MSGISRSTPSPRRAAYRILAFALLASFGCAAPTTQVSRGPVDGALHERTHHGLGPKSCPGTVSIPPIVDLNDGLTEEEAVAIALWNNRDLQALFATLGIAKGDLIQAGLLTNPQFNLLFPPIGSKQLEWTIFLPIEAFLLRKTRVTVAERDYQRVADELVQFGLNTARDTRLAYAELAFASDRYQLALEAVEVREGIASLAEKRLDAGDVSELEVLTARADAEQSRVEAVAFEEGVVQARERLRLVMGIATLNAPLDATPVPLPAAFDVDIEMLVAEAAETRPDLLAAGMLVAAATHRLELARKAYLRIDAVADGNHGGAGPSNVGPGLRVDLPIFNRNEGGIVRAEWELEQARNNYYAVHDRAMTEVRTSGSAVRQAYASQSILQGELLPTLRDSVVVAQKAYEDGGADYLLVLQSTQQYLNSRASELDLQAALARAFAELDRSVGRRVIPTIGIWQDLAPVTETPAPALVPELPLPADTTQTVNEPKNTLLPAIPSADLSFAFRSPFDNPAAPGLFSSASSQNGSEPLPAVPSEDDDRPTIKTVATEDVTASSRLPRQIKTKASCETIRTSWTPPLPHDGVARDLPAGLPTASETGVIKGEQAGEAGRGDEAAERDVARGRSSDSQSGGAIGSNLGPRKVYSRAAAARLWGRSHTSAR